MQAGIIEYIRTNIDRFHISTCLSAFSKFSHGNILEILKIFLDGISDNNEIIKKFRFLDLKVDSLGSEKLLEEDQKFIQANFVNKSGILSFKDSGMFKLSDLEVMTNPIQFDKVMDNFYFNLDSNAKKFIEYVSTEWNE